MENKNKLEGTYLPDNAGRKEKVVIGLSRSVDSLVAAYLLKIQKYDLIAITVANSWNELTQAQESVISCHLNSQDLEFLSEFCHGLGIPHQVVKMSNEFVENIIDPWISDKISGKISHPCWSCGEMRINILYKKMRELGASHFATGHYAKIFHHDLNKTVFIHSSNDEEFDQSSLLSRLSHDVLSSLILPLADITKKDVLKLADNFGLSLPHSKLDSDDCLKMNEELSGLIEKKVSQGLLSEGDIITSDGGTIGKHKGVQLYTLGKPLSEESSDERVFGSYFFLDKRIKVVEPDYFLRSKFLLKKCRFSEEISFPAPLSGWVLFSDKTWVECWIHPKNFSSVMIELNEKHKIIPDEMVTIFKKKGRNSKVYLTGEIHASSFDISVDGEKNVEKDDPLLDF